MIVACGPGQDTCYATMTIVEADYLAQTRGDPDFLNLMSRSKAFGDGLGQHFRSLYEPQNSTHTFYQVIVEKGCAKRADLTARKLRNQTLSLGWSVSEDTYCHHTSLQEESSPNSDGLYPGLESLNGQNNTLLRLGSKTLFELSKSKINEVIKGDKYYGLDDRNLPRIKERLPKIKWQSEICTCNWDQCNGVDQMIISKTMLLINISLLLSCFLK